MAPPAISPTRCQSHPNMSPLPSPTSMFFTIKTMLMLVFCAKYCDSLHYQAVFLPLLSVYCVLTCLLNFVLFDYCIFLCITFWICLPLWILFVRYRIICMLPLTELLDCVLDLLPVFNKKWIINKWIPHIPFLTRHYNNSLYTEKYLDGWCFFHSFPLFKVQTVVCRTFPTLQSETSIGSLGDRPNKR